MLISTLTGTNTIAAKKNSRITNYDLNRFVDRDMFMRYIGLGVGHVDTSVRAPPSLVKTDEVVDLFGNTDEFEDDEPIDANTDANAELNNLDEVELESGEEDEYEYEGEVEDEDYLDIDNEPRARL